MLKRIFYGRIVFGYLLESGTENSMLTAEPSINKINRANYVCSVELFLNELLTFKFYHYENYDF